MSNTQDMLTAQQFAERAGVTAATVSKWLRDGKLDGRKSGGKWLVSPDQLERTMGAAQPTATGGGESNTARKAAAPSPQAADSKVSFSVEAFAAMTFLTTAGVERFLKEGRLKGTRDENGNWRISAGNLNDSGIRHLLRK